MRKLVLGLITLLAVVTFVRTQDNSLTAGERSAQSGLENFDIEINSTIK